MSTMWKTIPTASTPLSVTPEPVRSGMPLPVLESAVHINGTHLVAGETCIGKGLLFKGTISGTGSLFVDGVVEGNIYLPESRVTVGENGYMSAGLSVCINAGEIVIIGRVHGSVSAGRSLEIRAEGNLTGNVSAARISIADGAYFKGNIELHGFEPKSAAPVPLGLNRQDLYVARQSQSLEH